MPSPAGGYVLRVTEGGQLAVGLSMQDLDSLPKVKLTADGKEQEGPTLLSVLSRAGFADFKRVTVVGMQRGRSHSAELALERAKVTDQVILDINKQGQTKLASPDIPGEAWIIDVSELQAER